MSELISFVHQIPDGNPLQPGRRRLLDDANAPRVDRLPVPPWVPGGEQNSDRGNLVLIRDRGDLVLDLEQEVSSAALPPELRAANPPIDTLAYYLPLHLHESE